MENPRIEWISQGFNMFIYVLSKHILFCLAGFEASSCLCEIGDSLEDAVALGFRHPSILGIKGIFPKSESDACSTPVFVYRFGGIDGS